MLARLLPYIREWKYAACSCEGLPGETTSARLLVGLRNFVSAQNDCEYVHMYVHPVLGQLSAARAAQIGGESVISKHCGILATSVFALLLVLAMCVTGALAVSEWLYCCFSMHCSTMLSVRVFV